MDGVDYFSGADACCAGGHSWLGCYAGGADVIIMRVNQSNVRDVFRAMFQRAKGLVGEYELVLREPVRTESQNRKMWPMLSDVAKQVDMCVNGEMVKASPEDWKDVFSASLHREQRIAKGVDGGVVFLGSRTSRMRKAEFVELIELIYAFGAERGVKWSDPVLRCYEQYREARA